MINQLDVPPSVRKQLRLFRRRLFWVESGVAVLMVIATVLAGYTVLFVSDRLWDTPRAVRLALVLVLMGVTAASAFFWFYRWIWRQRTPRQLARMMQRVFPQLGDRLLGIVELGDQRLRPQNISADLCHAAMEQVARETAGLAFAEGVPTQQRTRIGWIVAALLLLVGAGVVLAPEAGRNAWRRLVKPVASIARYTLVHIDELPSVRVVPHGEPFRVEGRVADTARWVPRQVRGVCGNQPPVSATIENQVFGLEFPGQASNVTLQIRVGDARASIDVQPTHRPQLTRLWLEVQHPEYLQLPTTTNEIRGARVELLRQSEVIVRGSANRFLAEAILDNEALAVEQETFVAPARTVTQNAEWNLTWQDHFGLSGLKPLSIKVHARDDTPPSVRVTQLPHVVTILDDEILRFEAVATDDFGVATLDVTWQGEGNPSSGINPSRGSLNVANGDPASTRLTGPVDFSPAALGIAPQKLTLHARARDFKPGREPSLSSPYVIYVLDRLEHARYVRRAFDQLQAQLEEIARREESLFHQNQALEENLKNLDDQKELRDQERAEQDNAQSLRQLQEKGAALLRQALRNQAIAEHVLQQWSETLSTMRELATAEMPRVAASLGQAGSSSEDGEQRRAINDALDRQQQVLQQMQQALQQMGDTGDQMVAGNFINRLREASSTETAITTNLKQLIPQTIGIPVSDLSVALQGQVNRVATRQQRNQQTVEDIRDDLGGFFSRTRQEAIGEIHDQMVEEDIVEHLDALSRQIGVNQGARSIDQTIIWAAALSRWADLLTATTRQERAGAAAGSADGGSPSAELLELAMRLVRLRQAEEGLREQTRFLERHREQNPHYATGAARMASLQRSLIDLVTRTRQEFPVPMFTELLERVENAMNDAASLLERPQTDRQTIAAETEVIEQLSLSAMKASSSGQSGHGQSALLALMQMMGIGNSQGAGSLGSGGGNLGGRSDSRTLSPRWGVPSSTDHVARQIEQASGRDRATFPAEFRDVLDAYFRAREERP